MFAKDARVYVIATGQIGTVKHIVIHEDDEARYGIHPDDRVGLTYYREPELAPVSYKVEVLVSGKWSTNSVRYATREEAELAGQELLSRWFVPEASRAAEAADPVNYIFNRELFRPERIVMSDTEGR